ncbi:MAG: CPBP family intramembrane metalloprotease [Bacteroidia bacterium]|nr:CPBP family intramembrane metalloprotease [Bacteroidia bacterium]
MTKYENIKIKNWWIVVLMTIGLIIGSLAFAGLFYKGPFYFGRMPVELIRNTSVSLFVIFLVQKMKVFDFKLLFNFNKWVYLVLSIFALIIINNIYVDMGAGHELPIIFYEVGHNMSTGFYEELLIRGIILISLLSRFSVFKSVLISSLLFSVLHILNFIFGYQTFFHTFNQLLYSFGIGTIFAFLYLKLENILVPIIFHGTMNFINTDYVEESVKGASTIVDGVEQFSLSVLAIICIFISFYIYAKMVNSTKKYNSFYWN